MSLLARLLKFAGVGAIATAIQYVLLVALVELAAFEPVPASSIGYAAGAAFGYFANHRWTFGGRAAHSTATLRYAAMLGFGFALNAAVVWILHNRAGLWYVAAQVVATGIGLFVNFAIASRWVYAERRGPGTR